MAGQEQVRVKRSDVAHFLDVAPGTVTPKWARIGKGVESAQTDYNPNVAEEHYIDEDSASKLVDGYAPVLPAEQKAYKGNEVFDYVDSLRLVRALGTEAETQLLNVFKYDKVGEAYKAEMQKVSISINSFGGDAGNAPVINYDVNYVGDHTPGTVVITDGKPVFTPDGDA